MVFNPSILAAPQVVWRCGSPLRIPNSLFACSQYFLDAVEVYVLGPPGTVSDSNSLFVWVTEHLWRLWHRFFEGEGGASWDDVCLTWGGLLSILFMVFFHSLQKSLTPKISTAQYIDERNIGHSSSQVPAEAERPRYRRDRDNVDESGGCGNSSLSTRSRPPLTNWHSDFFLTQRGCCQNEWMNEPQTLSIEVGVLPSQ